jgi:hydroxymethylbilane synthase
MVAAALARVAAGLPVEIVEVHTAGDRREAGPAWRGEAVGLFTTALEDALRADRIDAAVHSFKDLPIDSAEDLAIAAILEREDPADVLIDREGRRLQALPAGARVGTSSIRRRAQILARRHDLTVVEICGNVPTRLRQVETSELDAVVLALAGVRRLDREAVVTEVFPPDQWLPAAGQGAIAVQVRAGDEQTRRLLMPLDHQATRFATLAERELMAALDAGCRAPVGALGRVSAGILRLAGLVASVDGQRTLADEVAQIVRDEAEARALARRLATRLRDRGAALLLDEARKAVSAFI